MPLLGGQTSRLNNPLSFSEGVTSYLISPDGNKVVYTERNNNNSRGDIFSIRIDRPPGVQSQPEDVFCIPIKGVLLCTYRSGC